jgi:hypothetical protein
MLKFYWNVEWYYYLAKNHEKNLRINIFEDEKTKRIAEIGKMGFFKFWLNIFLLAWFDPEI